MIIGLTGSFGAGKGAVVDYLKTKGFTHYPVSDFLIEEIQIRNLPVNRDSMAVVANELRSTHGPSCIIDTLYKRAEGTGGDVVIESLRAVAEVKRIQELGGVVIGVTADPELRYRRAVARDSLKDDVSFEKWLSQEKAESNTDDETKQNIFGALALSDYCIENDDTFETLHTRIDEILKKIAS